MMVGTPWYEKTFWLVVWLFVFAPVGIYGMWKSSNALIWKIIATLIFGGVAISWITWAAGMLTVTPAGN
jgi:hypothetical protein